MFDHLVDQSYDVVFDMGLYPICAGMCHALGIPHIIDREVGPLDPRCKLSIGQIVLAFIINILHGRTPLYHMADAFSKVDCGVLFGEGVTHEDFTEDRLGTALDLISELDHRKIASEISMNALEIHGIPVQSSHIDTTNVSLSGDFDGHQDDGFLITYGNAKDGSKNKKLVSFGGAVQQDGLPVFGEGLSGNNSDVIWFRTAMDEMANYFQGTLMDNPILVYDAAASNEEMFDKAGDKEMPCITRLSANFNAVARHVNRAWEEDKWQDVGVLAKKGDKKSASYRIRSYDVKLGKYDWRLLVVHSSALEATKEATAKRKLPEAKVELTKAAETLSKKSYETPEEALKAGERFLEKRKGYKKLIDAQVGVETKTTSKYAKPGRPAKGAKKITITTYHATCQVGEVNEEAYEHWMQHESSFVLVSNIPKERYTDVQILNEYKKQWKIENTFRFLKQPVVLGSIWLQHSWRIKSLLFLLWLSVLVAAYIRHRMVESLRNGGSIDPKIVENLDKMPNVETVDSVEPRGAVSTPSGRTRSPIRIQTRAGRLVERPTFKIISDLFENVKIRTYVEEGVLKRKFLHQTKQKLFVLCVYIGFHPAIYLQSFCPAYDLWKYTRRE